MESTVVENPSANLEIDLSKVPICGGLSGVTKTNISVLLNPPKCFPTDQGLPKDWRGLAHLISLRISDVSTAEKDPTGRIFELWHQKNKESCNLKQLQLFLGQIDRWDICEDVKDMMEEDARIYLKLKDQSMQSAPDTNLDVDNEILTRHDVSRISQGLDTQHYDAFILFAEADIAFATEMMTNLEEHYNLKLCAKNRDLVGGHVFEHSAIMRLISERCNRLVIIVTQAFLKSALFGFFLNFAQALGIEQKKRKIVPLKLENCESLPMELRFYYMIDGTKFAKGNIWESLYHSIKTTPTVKTSKIPSTNIERSVVASKHLPVLTETENKKSEGHPTVDKVVTFNDNATAMMNDTPIAKPINKRPFHSWLKKFVHRKDKEKKRSKDNHVIGKSGKQKLAVLNN